MCVYTYRELKVMIDSYRNAITGECPLSRRVYYSPQGYCIRVSACVRRKKKDGRDIGWCIFDDFRVSILSLGEVLARVDSRLPFKELGWTEFIRSK